jgi:hypothetical protein
MSRLNKIIVLIGLSLPLLAHSGQDWSIDWYSIDSGGVLEASGGAWTLAGTLGQPDATAANALSGGGWQLTGGYWAVIAEAVDRIFADRFRTQNGLDWRGDDDAQE